MIARAWHEQVKLIDFIVFQEAMGSKVTREVVRPNKGANNVNNIQVGCKVHLKSINGIFTVKSLSTTGFVVTCKTWQEKFRRKEMAYQNKHVFYSDFKCFAGGRNNIDKNN